MVVAIHVNPFGARWGGLRFPITRIAVPLFFLISGYLLFEKLNGIGDNRAKNGALWQFVKRNLQLYCAWFCLLFPITAYNRGYFEGTVGAFFSKIFVQFFLGSTFTASWYIMALIIGALLVYWIARHFGNGVALFLGGATYIVCCLASNYGNLFAGTWMPVILWDWYPTAVYNSFPVALVWLAVGKWMADHRDWVQKKPPVFTGVVACVSAVGLLAEHAFIQGLGSAVENDCYFMLVPTCVCLFMTVLGSKAKISDTKWMRKLSTVTYCLHSALAFVLGWFLRYVGLDTQQLFGAMVLYLVVLAGCVAATWVIDTLRRFRHLSFLRFLM